MTMLLANSFDRAAADRLALQAARRGREGAPALETYFSALLPRWHGEPGDLVAACDLLKKQLGHDDAYYLMAGTALEYEGPEAVLDPGHPVSISWKRALNSYLDAQKAGRSTSSWAHKMLWYAYIVGQRAGAGALLPYLPIVDEPANKEWPICLPGTRLWAEGKLDPVAWERQKITCRRIGSNRQKASPGAPLGVEVKANAPLLFGSHFYLLIHSPTQTNKKGFQYQDCAVMADLRPFVDTSTRLTLEPDRAEEIQPGTYDLKLYEDGEVIYTDHYELTP